MNIRHLLLDTFAYMPPAHILGDLSEADAMQRACGNVHSIAEIVAHIGFWQDWLLHRCRGEGVPMAQRAAEGWPVVPDGSWFGLRDGFLNGLREAAEMGDDQARLQESLAPAIEFPPLASYTIADALVHVAAHNAHHLGQIITLRQIMGKWPPTSGSWTW